VTKVFMPYLLVLILSLVIIALIPEITLVLPNLLMD
jgi:TRAP-type C4-dicarboxylate transport system permease large subunit